MISNERAYYEYLRDSENIYYEDIFIEENSYKIKKNNKCTKEEALYGIRNEVDEDDLEYKNEDYSTFMYEKPKGNRKYGLKNNNFFKTQVKIRGNEEYICLSDYIGASHNVRFKHIIKECGREFIQTANNFLQGTRCPFCSNSKGEVEIRKFLTDNNIKFGTQYIFNDLLSDLGFNLKFDFGIIENNNLKLLIEFDGIQHFELIEGWYTQEKFEQLRYHDKLKNEYCIKNNIELIRIKYDKFNEINDILTKILINNEKIDEFIVK